jgi:hypothetical protein
MRQSHFPGLCCDILYVCVLSCILVTSKPIWTDFSFENIVKIRILNFKIECRNYNEQVVEPASCLAVLNTFSGFVVLGSNPDSHQPRANCQRGGRTFNQSWALSVMIQRIDNKFIGRHCWLSFINWP